MFRHILTISYFNLRPTNPAHGRQLVLQQKVVRFVIKAPLADGQVSASAFNLKLTKCFNEVISNVYISTAYDHQHSNSWYLPVGSSPQIFLVHISGELCSPQLRSHPTYAWSWALEAQRGR